MENAEGRCDLRGVRRNAIQISDYVDKILVLKSPKIGMLQLVGLWIELELHSSVNIRLHMHAHHKKESFVFLLLNKDRQFQGYFSGLSSGTQAISIFLLHRLSNDVHPQNYLLIQDSCWSPQPLGPQPI